MHKPKFKIGDTVYIKKGELGSLGGNYNSTEDSPNTKITRVRPNYAYPYSVDCSAQDWKESSLEVAHQTRKNLIGLQHLKDYEKMHDEDFGTIIKLPTGYLFNKPVTFVPTKLKETL